jgi:hypothetical protein
MRSSRTVGRPNSLATASARPEHGTQHADGQRLGLGHAQALGQQVGEQDEQGGDGGEREQETHGLCAALGQPEHQQFGQVGGQCAFAHHAAQDGDGVQPDLRDREVLARLGLHLHDQFGAGFTILHHLPKPQAPGGGQRDFGHGEEGTGQYQCKDQQQALGQAHRQGGNTMEIGFPDVKDVSIRPHIACPWSWGMPGRLAGRAERAKKSRPKAA